MSEDNITVKMFLCFRSSLYMHIVYICDVNGGNSMIQKHRMN